MLSAFDDGRHGVVEVEILLAGQRLDLLGQCHAGQRAGGDDGRTVGDGVAFLAMNVDVRMVRQCGCHLFGKIIAAHGQRTPCGHGIAIGNVDDLAPHPHHLVLENAQRPVGQGAAHGVATDQFGQAVGCVRFGRACGTHLIEVDLDAAVGHLPCRLTAGQPAADNRHLFHHLPPWPGIDPVPTIPYPKCYSARKDLPRIRGCDGLPRIFSGKSAAIR